APHERGVKGQVRGQHLERHPPAQARLDRLVDDAHAALSQDREDLDAREFRKLLLRGELEHAVGADGAEAPGLALGDRGAARGAQRVAHPRQAKISRSSESTSPSRSTAERTVSRSRCWSLPRTRKRRFFFSDDVISGGAFPSRRARSSAGTAWRSFAI